MNSEPNRNSANQEAYTTEENQNNFNEQHQNQQVQDHDNIIEIRRTEYFIKAETKNLDEIAGSFEHTFSDSEAAYVEYKCAELIRLARKLRDLQNP